MVTEIDKLQREFFEYLEIEKGSSARTIENYQHYLGRFLEHTKEKNASDITDDVLRVFLKYLVKREIKSLPPDRIELAKIPERSIDLISPAELTRLLDMPKGND